MAKQLVGPVERHVEKVVLGVAGLVLVGVIARFLVTSPNRIDIDGELESPGTIDARVLRIAGDVRERTRRAEPKQEMPEPLFGDFIAQLKLFEAQGLALELPAAVSIGPEVPLIDAAEVIVGHAELVSVVELDKPEIVVGRSIFVDGGFDPVNWVSVSSLMNREGQMQRQIKTYGSSRKDVIFGVPQLQRRARRQDGSWTDEDWEFVDTLLPSGIPSAPEIFFEMQDGETTVPREMHGTLAKFVEALAEPQLQMNLLRPLMPDVSDGSMWCYPKIVDHQQVLLMDDEYLHPNATEPSEELEDRYPTCEKEDGGVAVVGQVKALKIGQRLEAALQEAEKLLQEARQERNEDKATEAYNSAGPVSIHFGATPAQKKKAKALMSKASMLQNDIEREKRRRKGQRPKMDDSGDDERERILLPTQQMWANDARRGELISGQTYQFRLRAQIYNRLAGEPGKFADERDAKVVFVEGPWSPPSDPVEIEPDLEFFVTGSDQRKRTISINMFLWFEGFWVTHGSKFKFEVGDVVAERARVAIPDADDPAETQTPWADFATGEMVADIDWGKPYRDRKRRGGVKFSTPTTACSVVFVDGSGRLRQRFVPTDKGHPDKKSLAERVYKPPKKKRN